MTNYFFKFERRQVERLEMDVLLDVFNPEQISPYSLRDYFGSVKIEFGGYVTGQDPHPILIPELRRFLRALSQRWGLGAAAFFCELDSPFLLLLITAQLEHVKIFERSNDGVFVLFHCPEELSAIERTTLAELATLAERAGMPAAHTQQHQQLLRQLIAGIFCHPLPIGC